MIKLKLRKRTRKVDETSRTNNSLGLMFWAAVSFLSVLIFCAIFADILPFKNPTQTFKGFNKNGPSGSFCSAMMVSVETFYLVSSMELKRVL
jgi:hypothetical protein